MRGQTGGTSAMARSWVGWTKRGIVILQWGVEKQLSLEGCIPSF